ncbi:AMP-binding protein [Vibrio sp. TRT 17S01]|uniref:AMP-binding protein n=1 Tax=Vibrio sp. TRT 17S01 TaxID=3418505 RepID=UPI003CF01EB5
MNHPPMNFTPLRTLLSAKRPDNYPVSFTGNHINHWQQFLQDVTQLSQVLSTKTGNNIALCCGNSYQFAVGFFAVCAAGKALVLPGNYQPAALNELAIHFDLLLVDSEVEVPSGINALVIHQHTFSQESTVPVMLTLADIRLTLFTSGSSGTPKAIEKTLTQLESEIDILQRLWGEQLSATQIESTVSHQHIYGLLFRVLWPLCAARPFAAYNLEFPEQVISHAGPNTTLISSPALLKRLNEEHQSTKLRMAFSSGGPLANQAANHACELFGQYPIEVYGSTETGGIAFRQQHSATTPWQLFPGIEAELNEESCLKLKSPHIDANNWYQTADECIFHDKVHFELKGRTDRIIKVEEKRVSLVEVERRVEQLSWVEETAVIPMMEGDRLTLVAAIVLNQQGKQQFALSGKGKFWLLLRNELRQWLEPIAVPRRFRVFDEIPLNSQGKRQTAEIEALFQQ